MALTHHIRAGYNGKVAELEIRLPVIVFQEAGSYIAYIPILDLSGYGESEDEAKLSLDVVLEDYIDYALQHHTLHADLIKHGFKFKEGASTVQAPSAIETLRNNSTFNSLVESKPFNKVDKAVTIPAFC